MKKFFKNLKISRVLIFIILSIYALMIVLPLVWMVLSGFKDNAGLFLNTWALPEVYHWENYAKAWRTGIGRYFFNSIYVTLLSVVFTIFISTLCAFALSRLEFTGQKALLVFVIGGLMLSPQVSLISLYRALQRMHIYDTHWALIIPYVAYRLPFTIFLIRSYMISLPREFEDSAYIDGCSTWKVFYKIIVPMCKPILATASLFTAMSCWNEFMFALVFIEKDALRTIPVGMMNLRSSLSTEWTVLLAGLTLSVLPMAILYFVFQKQFVRGITSGGVKE